MDVWFATKKWRIYDFHHHGFVVIIITMAIVYYNNNNNLENHIRHVIWLGYNLYIILNKFNINKLDKNKGDVCNTYSSMLQIQLTYNLNTTIIHNQ
jgi:hypothetical protein